MSECKHHVSHDIRCTLCRVGELEAKIAELEKILTAIANGDEPEDGWKDLLEGDK